MAKPEHILAVDQAHFVELGMESKDGATIFDAPEGLIFPSSSLFIGQRDFLETDKRFRQVIPYTALMNREGAFLVYRRRGGEKRLDAKLSIGFGGHVDLADICADTQNKSVINLNHTLQTAGLRELHEELGLTGKEVLDCDLKGIIVEDATEVGMVHVGVAQVAKVLPNVDCSLIDSKESCIEIIGWLTPQQALEGNDNWELWSEALLEKLREEQQEQVAA